MIDLPSEIHQAHDNAAIASSLAQWCGVPMPGALDGQIIGAQENSYAIAQCANVGQTKERNITWMNERFRATWYPEHDHVLLFDHRADPNETVNVAAEYPDVVASAMTTLTRSCVRSWRPHQGRVSPW